MISALGWHNLRRDPVRVAFAVAAVIFAVVLVTVEVGMLLGLMRNASLLVQNSRADLWVSTVDVGTFDFATPFNHRKKYRVQAVPGVESAEEYFVSYSALKLPSGGSANVQIIGVDLRGSLAAPLQMSEGSADLLLEADTIVIDEADRAKLGNPRIGDSVEIVKRKAKVVGFTRGMRSFTTTPYIFTSLQSARKYGVIAEKDKVVYVLVKAAVGADVEALRAAIQAAVPGIDVYTRDGLSWRTQRYWLVETGVGLGFLGAAFLGLLVGGVVVSQTLYAMTVEKLAEFAVLKALGATMAEVSAVVLQQALLCGAVGLIAGIAISAAIRALALNSGTTIEMPLPLMLFVAVLIVSLCVGASLVSVLRLKRLEPAMMFRS